LGLPVAAELVLQGFDGGGLLDQGFGHRQGRDASTETFNGLSRALKVANRHAEIPFGLTSLFPEIIR
jgi:hypothetical protein